MDKQQNGGFMSMNLSEMKIPKFIEIWNPTYNYYTVGEDNKWFLNLLDMYYKSSIHASIINNLWFQITKDKQDDEFYKRIALDYILFGSFSVECVWNINHTGILKMNHLDVSKVRIGKPDDQNDPLFYFYSNDWFKYSNKKIDMLQSYNPNTEFSQHQIYYAKRYIAGEDVYPKPYYFAGVKWIITDIELENYYANLIQNNFVSNTLINVPAYFDQDRQKAFEKDIKSSFTGSENAGRIFITYSEDRDHAPTIERFNNDEDDTRYRFLTEQITQQVSLSHMLPIPLLGILVPGKLGNATDLPIFQQIYQENVVQPLRSEIDRKLQPLLDKKISM
jgi:hypothetical protein